VVYNVVISYTIIDFLKKTLQNQYTDSIINAYYEGVCVELERKQTIQHWVTNNEFTREYLT